MTHAPDSMTLKLRQRGLSLVELMISIALGMIVILAITYVFAGSRASHRNQESLSAVQESGRMALELLTRDIRMTGFPGCGNLAFLDHRSPDFSNANVITGVANAAAVVPDTVTLLHGSANLTTVDAMPATNQLNLVSAVALGPLEVGDRLLVSDCTFTEVVTLSVLPVGNLITATAPLGRQFAPGSRVMRLETVAYTVAGNELLRNGQAVAGGTENMKLFYGIDSNGDRSVNEYVNNPGALPPPLGWPSVVAVRVNLTIAQGGLSMPFSTTIALRNRAP